jgi:hypothetical protein
MMPDRTDAGESQTGRTVADHAFGRWPVRIPVHTTVQEETPLF